MRRLHIDVETYSSVPLKKSGVHPYVESIDFEVLTVAYCFAGENIKNFSPALGHAWPAELTEALTDPGVEKHAYNAPFEFAVFEALGFDLDVSQWHCTMVRAARAGLPLGLKNVTDALRFDEDAKSSTGTALINFFCKPRKATKLKKELRNRPENYPGKFQALCHYCVQDVRAEMAVYAAVEKYSIPAWERYLWLLDQKINRRGVKLDLELAAAARKIDQASRRELFSQAREATGLDNPNSGSQLLGWLAGRGHALDNLQKGTLADLLESPGLSDDIAHVVKLKQKLAKTSNRKYYAIPFSASADGRARGLFQYYGAFRTGRWGGRRIQPQNLPQNHLPDLDGSREAAKTGDIAIFRALHKDAQASLSQLIRTTLVASEGNLLTVVDFSAIEARVLAYLAGESWRMDVFRSHGKIYEASAARMFDVPFESIAKDSPLRQQGKISELALGYQGSVGAVRAMEDSYRNYLGMTDSEVKQMVDTWRRASPAIVDFWYGLNRAVKQSVSYLGKTITFRPHDAVAFKVRCGCKALRIQMPNGRCLSYWEPRFYTNRFGKKAVGYMGIDAQTGKWKFEGTYGGKLTENVVQAFARDILAESMLRIDSAGLDIVMHVHDEVCVEGPAEKAEQALETIKGIMSVPPDWAPGLPVKGEGYVTPYYKKD